MAAKAPEGPTAIDTAIQVFPRDSQAARQSHYRCQVVWWNNGRDTPRLHVLETLAENSPHLRWPSALEDDLKLVNRKPRHPLEPTKSPSGDEKRGEQEEFR